MSLNVTPSANRLHIGIYGATNAGKSSLINAIIGQDVSLVSDVKGTTTDPVTKPMELLPLGPVVFIDTAGLGDDGELGALRIERTLKVLQRTDFAIYLNDITNFDEKEQENMIHQFKKFNIPYMIVFNKIDKADKETLNSFKKLYKDAQFISTSDDKQVIELKNALIDKIKNEENEPTIIGDLVPYGGTVVMVVPIDSEAPKGRIILPQVQLIRDCLDNGIKSYLVRDTELKDALGDLKHIDLVVTDSQAFKSVSAMVPENIPLTSFSILFARYKGDIKSFVHGVNVIKDLKDGANILISESCTHNHSHEDIGRYKIPKLLNHKENKTFNYDFRMGHNFPENLSEYNLVIHCGSCMLNKKTMQSRIMICNDAGVPITNYGVVLAYATSILDRTLKVKNL
ncbi:[FeFe] hydrogenase H-cluster maturation GTPase HydF [Tissierella creatinophila]|uniref:tRNA modification GTPase MnmE n=1 Tax=Tissierella creatinophila DSM 6911 TaxID=1123403 RepID=A0A1U7M966_TISCR|nr:[FeFe] hydrogenase H-cluster maturation GTPase HydF [Tissierella creatinophila]OLS03826.1 tRNA modification GTPase MnmE [Tissierella creatinophila DSM 6911]